MAGSTSLRNRLLVATALTLLVFLGLVYIALEQAFVSSVTRSEAEKLHSTILLLLAEAEADHQQLHMPDVLQEARFNQLDSGLYGFVFDSQGREVWRSYSAIALTELPDIAGFRQAGVAANAFGPTELNQEGFLYASMGIAWEYDSTDSDEPDTATREFTFSLLQSADFFYAELEQFRTGLLVRLLGVGLVLLIAQLLVLRLGLRPLTRLSRDVQGIERGDIKQLSGSYPKELHGLTESLNQLLTHEREQREQYKHRLSDLAHSLKTPLSIASGALLEKNHDRNLLAEQLQQMDHIVQYQLQRANRARPAIAQQQIKLAPLVHRIVDALQKVYSDKAVTVTLQLDEQASCRVDESDLMEMLGNLLDNAFKYCLHKVIIEVTCEEQDCILRIADDGPGVPVDMREQIFGRGERLDTRRPGQGIGLAVVSDIAASYDASVSVGGSELGGALFELRLLV